MSNEQRKRPWEPGFEIEEAKQKREHRKKKGDNPDAIRDYIPSLDDKKK